MPVSRPEPEPGGIEDDGNQQDGDENENEDEGSVGGEKRPGVGEKRADAAKSRDSIPSLQLSQASSLGFL